MLGAIFLLDARIRAAAGMVGYPLAAKHDRTIILVYENDSAI